jgi:hypothetical protein
LYLENTPRVSEAERRAEKAQEAKLILSDANCGQSRGRTGADEWRKANGIWVSLFPSLSLAGATLTHALTHFFIFNIILYQHFGIIFSRKKPAKHFSCSSEMTII